MVFIIGGGEIYKQGISFADRLYLTEVDAIDNEADTYFPAFKQLFSHREELAEYTGFTSVLYSK